MNRNISVSVQEELYPYVQKKTNISRYVNELIKQDIQMQQKKPIVKAVIDELLESEEFFSALEERLGRGIKQMAPPPLASQSKDSLPYLTPDAVTLQESSAYQSAVGKPCCSLTKPCKHWAFDGVEGVWKNELTGVTKEV